ncbi:hypothetical protein M378DRAFT_179303 [Amanita muscaria Koide BX008]|uniref:Reverse transcriptase n=1 Tax=Amanita muscaria (strain Koide BX008) TaxID=946122 RepID=A0A0C2T9I0_AMAMK|nr:hypothetical protein M378DRAFT_179303 [Amanita muscaria Koide BX008]
MTVFAKYEQENASKPPTLTEGKVTPQTLYRFEQGCKRYFSVKSVTESTDQISRAIAGVRDPAIVAWFEADNENLSVLSFADFMASLRERILDPDWEAKIRREMSLNKYSLSVDFQQWADNISFLNRLLPKPEKRLEDAALRELLQNNLDDDFDEEIRNSETTIRTDTIKNWMVDVRRIADRRRRDIKRVRDAIAEDKEAYYRVSKRPAATSISTDRPRPFLNTTNGSKYATSTNVPKLTFEERQLLNKNEGCFKCREFYVDHLAGNCPTGFPDAKTYVPLTKEMALAAKRKKEGRAAPPSRASTSRVAAVISRSPSPDVTASPVAAVLSDDAVSLGDEDDVDPNVQVSDYKLPHLRFDCIVHGADFASEALNVFLDCGSPFVLIHPSLVESLGLTKRRLPQAEKFKTATRNPVPQNVNEYVWLRLSIPSSNWSAKKVMALVCESLNMKLLLGLPWLAKNKLVTDHERRTCICKDSNIDILQPCVVSRPKRAVMSKDKLKQIKLAKMDCLEELQRVCDYRRQLHAGRFECTSPVMVGENMVAAIVSKLEKSEQMRTADRELRAQFGAIFEPIPHVDLLPDEVQARIVLKDASKRITTRSYACPRKYRDAWRVLIQKHLDTGRIRPSSSPFASPAFVIPKTDPAVLPRWVNDYRQLNDNTVVDSHPLPRLWT